MTSEFHPLFVTFWESGLLPGLLGFAIGNQGICSLRLDLVQTEVKGLAGVNLVFYVILRHVLLGI